MFLSIDYSQIRCNMAADIGFILDSSYSLRKKYTDEKYFLKTLAGTFDITNNDVQASVVTFSSWAQLSIKFSDHKTTDAFNAAVDAIPLMGLQTRIDKALRKAQSDMYIAANGARSALPKILILLTDGSQTGRNPEDPAVVAKELRDAGVYLIVVGIGSNVKQDELISIAGSDANVFTASSFDELITQDFIQKVSLTTCPGKFLLYVKGWVSLSNKLFGCTSRTLPFLTLFFTAFSDIMNNKCITKRGTVYIAQ